MRTALMLFMILGLAVAAFCLGVRVGYDFAMDSKASVEVTP